MSRRLSPTLALLCISPALADPTITVHTQKPGPALTSRIIGANMANWFDITQSGIAAALQGAHFTALRWPGGSASDTFHWSTNSECNGGYVDANATFDAFMQDVAIPLGANVAITLNYGSNAACNDGGSPAEAASWVTYAQSQNYPAVYWTVGNEEYGSWEYDLHAKPHDAATYAAAVATGFYPQIKAANAAAQLGVVVNPGNQPDWDSIVLAQAKYDFVEYHFYAQAPGSESDTYLVDQAPAAFSRALASVRADLKAAGHAQTPIFVGELGSVYANPGKQTSSITQALYAGQVIGEMMKAGVARASWWLGFGGCSDSSGGNFSSSLYGWQDFGGYMMFSDGLPEYGCSDAAPLALGVPLPTARAFQVMSILAQDGQKYLPLTIEGGGVRAFAATQQGGGVAVALFNLNKTQSVTATLALDGRTQTSGVTETVYDKSLYDESASGTWAAPSVATLPAGALPAAFALTPWSMTVLQVSP